jgi:hypothetical protein
VDLQGVGPAKHVEYRDAMKQILDQLGEAPPQALPAGILGAHIGTAGGSDAADAGAAAPRDELFAQGGSALQTGVPRDAALDDLSRLLSLSAHGSPRAAGSGDTDYVIRRYHDVLASRSRGVILIENAGRTANVEALLPQRALVSPLQQITVIVTSRKALGLAPLAASSTCAVHQLTIHPLSPAAGASLAQSLAPFTALSPSQAREIAALTGGFPTAIRLAAAALHANPGLTGAALVSQLAAPADGARLSLLAPSVVWAVRQLEHRTRVFLASLSSVFPRSFTLPAAAAVWGGAQQLGEAAGSVVEVTCMLGTLVGQSFLDFDDMQRRYRVVDPIREISLSESPIPRNSVRLVATNHFLLYTVRLMDRLIDVHSRAYKALRSQSSSTARHHRHGPVLVDVLPSFSRLCGLPTSALFDTEDDLLGLDAELTEATSELFPAEAAAQKAAAEAGTGISPNTVALPPEEALSAVQRLFDLEAPNIEAAFGLLRRKASKNPSEHVGTFDDLAQLGLSRDAVARTVIALFHEFELSFSIGLDAQYARLVEILKD